MSEEEVGVKLLGDPLMLGELLPIVGRERVNAGCKRRRQGEHGIGDGLGGLERHMGNQGVTGLALIERDERLLLTGADDQITFPVSEAFAAINDERPLLDRNLVGDGAASFTSPVTLFARLLAAQGVMHGCHRHACRHRSAGRWFRG